MSRKFKGTLTDEAWGLLNTYAKQANDGFIHGWITLSDVLNEIILSTRVEIPLLRMKHLNIRKSLRVMARDKEMDLDLALKSLSEMKSNAPKRVNKSAKSPIERCSEITT